MIEHEPQVVADAIGEAWTIPSAYYEDPALYTRIIERVFARSWQWAGDLDMVKVPGQVAPLMLLEGSLDEPILFTRDMDDQLRCMSNVCTHRGALVCEAPGVERFLRCRYHGRRFGLDGAFQSMPEFEGVCDFPSKADDLPSVPFALWRQFLFAGVAPERSFDAFIADVQRRVGWLPIENFVYDPTGKRDYLVRANWALYVDNYLEGFHIPFVHAALAETLDYGSYRSELFDGGNVQVGVARGAEDAFDLPASSPDYGSRIAAYYYWLFPNLMLNFYPWGLSINVVYPLGVDRTRVSFYPYVWKPELRQAGAGAGLDRVEREDEVVVESVQKGVRSRFYDRGRYSPARENGVHQFHQLLVAATR
ncbi:MAG: aromatic ring-hydroxylating oxygenase subunit alpha [Fimbriimonadaceae bacterium]